MSLLDFSKIIVATENLEYSIETIDNVVQILLLGNSEIHKISVINMLRGALEKIHAANKNCKSIIRGGAVNSGHSSPHMGGNSSRHSSPHMGGNSRHSSPFRCRNTT